jgi:hypothetical protein
MTAECMPVRDSFKGEPMIKRANHHNWISLTSYSGAGLWDGKAKRYSWYA